MNDVELGARANAHWCDAVCRAHGIEGAVAGDVWASARRTPPFYPDAVTLAAGAEPDAILALVDPSAGCSVKDSYADVDLAGHGFDVLFEATWLRADPASDASGWSRVEDEAELDRWGDIAFPRSLLAAAGVAFVRCGDTAAILNATEGAIGLSNVVGDRDAAYAGAASFARQVFGAMPVIGYDREPVATARAVGELRVWMKPV